MDNQVQNTRPVQDNNFSFRKKILLKCWAVFSWTLVGLTILLTIAIVGVKIIGITPYAVLSGSMDPTYKTGDIVYVKTIKPEDIKENDVITYIHDESEKVISHRAIRIDQKNMCLYTKGDANKNPDSNLVPYKNILGIVVFSLPKLGYVSSYFTSTSGQYTAFTMLFAILLLCVVTEIFKKQ